MASVFGLDQLGAMDVMALDWREVPGVSGSRSRDYLSFGVPAMPPSTLLDREQPRLAGCGDEEGTRREGA